MRGVREQTRCACVCRTCALLNSIADSGLPSVVDEYALSSTVIVVAYMFGYGTPYCTRVLHRH